MLSEYSTTYYSVNNKVSELSLVENDRKCGVSRDEQNQGVSLVQTAALLSDLWNLSKSFIFIKK